MKPYFIHQMSCFTTTHWWLWPPEVNSLTSTTTSNFLLSLCLEFKPNQFNLLYLFLIFFFLFFEDVKDMPIEFLPNKSFPILIDSIGGECKKSNGSFYNTAEVVATMKYVSLLLASKIMPSQIGNLLISNHFFIDVYTILH